MQLQLKGLALALASGALLTLTGCGGGGGSAESATTDLSTTVIDGAIQNAVVCLDKNANGACDADEPQGKTDVAGKVTFAVANADVGKFSILAVVGTDAVDADSGPVATAFVMTAPADKPTVVSPLTTLVHQVMTSSGSSSDEAGAAVKSLTGISVSVFADYTLAATPPADGTDPALLARMLVVTTQQQFKAVESEIGKNAADGKVISRADIDRAARKKMLERIPGLLTAITDPAVKNAAPGKDREAALLVAATTLATDTSALKPAGIATEVAINNQIAAPVAEAVTAPAAGTTLANLTYTDASNYFARFFTATAVQNTPDANNNVKYVDRRYRANTGVLAKWGIGSDPRRQSDLNWNGSAWVACPLNFEGTSTVRDAQGNSSYTYCDNRETGKNNSAIFDVAGKTMKEVYDSVIAAGYTNFTIANSSTALGAATFPVGSKLRYSSTTTLTSAIQYVPAGKDNPPGVSEVVSQYSPAITAGGVASTQAAGTGCNSAELNGNGTPSATLENMAAAMTGNPCVFTGGSFSYQNVTYTNPDPTNESWGPATLSLGTLGTAPVGSGTAPGFYTTNTRFRVAFKGTGTNATTYYACKQRFNNGSSRNCVEIGTGSYTITTLGDARVMTFNNLPARMAPLTFNQLFVERNGVVYFGFQSKLGTFNNARLNTAAGTALLTQLGMPVEDPAVPLALTAGSYQGVYDLNTTGTAHPGGVVVTISASGTASCRDSVTQVAVSPCTVTTTDAATGAFSASIDNATMTGTVNFLTGIGSGTRTLPDAGSFTVFRR